MIDRMKDKVLTWKYFKIFLPSLHFVLVEFVLLPVLSLFHFPFSPLFFVRKKISRREEKRERNKQTNKQTNDQGVRWWWWLLLLLLLLVDR